MLENWDKVKQYAQTGANSAGTAMEKYGIVLESVEAKQAQLTAKVQEFYSSILNSGLIAGLLDVGKAFMDIINLGDGLVGKILLMVTALTALNFVIQSNSLAGFRTVLVELGGAIKTVITAIPTWIAGLKAQKTAQDALNASTATGNALAMANPYLAIAEIAIMAIMGIKFAIDKHNQSIQESIDKANELTDAYKSSSQEIQDGINSLTKGSGSYGSLQSEFDELCKGVDKYGNNISLTSDQYERYKSICEQIVGLNPDLMDGYNSATEAIGNQNSVLADTIQLLKDKAKLEAQEYADNSDEILKGAKNEYEQSTVKAQDWLKITKDNIGVDLIKRNKDTLTEALNINGYNGTLDTSVIDDKTISDIKDNWKEYRKILEDNYKKLIDDNKFKELTDENQKKVKNNIDSFFSSIEYAVKNQTDAENTISNASNTFYDKLSTVYNSVAQATNGYGNLSGDARNFLADFYNEAFKVDDLNSITDKVFNQNKQIVANIVQAMQGENGSKLESIFDKFYSIDADRIDFDDYEKQSQKIAQKISNILQQDLTGDGLIDSADVAKIKIALDADIDADKIKQRTHTINELIKEVVGNVEGMADLSIKDEFSDYFKGLSTTELDRAKVALQLFGNEIKNVADLKDKMNIFDGMDTALNGVAEGFSNAESNARSYKETMKSLSDGEKSTEYDTAFNAHTDAVKALEEEFKKGTVGSKKFAESAKYLFGESFDVTNVDEVYKRLSKLQELFKEGTYGEGLLKRLKELGKVGDSWAKKNKDGTWNFNIDTSEKGIKQLAKQMGIAEDGVWSCLLALQMLGEIDIFDTEGIEDYAKQLGLVEEKTTKVGDKQKTLKTLNVSQLRDTLSQAGINVEFLDEALKGLEEKGYILIDTAGKAQTLANNMRDLGLIANDGTIDLTNVVSQLQEFGYGKDQIQSVIDKLKQFADESGKVKIGDKKVNVKVEGADEAQTKIDAIKDNADEASKKEATPTIEVKGAKEANNTIDGVESNLRGLDGQKATVTITTNKTTNKRINYSWGFGGDDESDLNGIGNDFSGKSHLKGTAFTQGNWGAKTTETALVGEIAPEIWVHADTGKWELVTNPQFLRIKKGDVIFNGQQTRDLLGKGSSLSFGTSFLGGTAYDLGSPSFSGADRNKKKYNVSGSVSSSSKSSGSSSSKSSGSSSSKSSGSSSSDKKWWETQLENLKDNLDYNAITMDTYINGIENILKKLKKGSKDWKEVNKELQSARLEQVENQFDRGEITIDQYISKLTELRKNYKKNTEEYKELTQKINEGKADKFADQYERGEISLKSYITQLTKLRNSYKKNSEKWKEYNDLTKETKLDDLNDRYERGKITTDEYIKGLLRLADTYKDGSKEAKEFEKTVMDAYADNMADKYERGEISLKKYINELIYMRSHYKKNSEEWKKFNDLINSTKADYYADQYERGKISADTYIKKLEELRETCKKGSKEYQEYTDEINNAKLDKAEKYVESLTKKVEKFDKKIARLGNINTDKEKKQYAELLSGEYEQVQSNKEDTKAKLDADKKYDDSIKKRNKLLKEQEKYKKGSKEYNNIQKEINYLNKYISKHKEDNLTAEQRTKYQEYYNDLLEEEVDIRDEIEDKVREYYENQKEQAEQQAELTRKKKLYEKEVELYGEDGKDLWEYNNNKKIDEIQKVIDQRNAEKEALDDINEREELSNNLLEAKLKLQNALNNKTTKILTKQEDGTWAYTFSANMSDVKSAKDEVKSAQKSLDDYDWEQETKKLESQIDELNANAENLSKQYDDAEFWADREYEQTMNNIEQVYGDIDGLVEQWMNTYGTTTDNLISSYQSLTNASIALENSLVDFTIKNNASYETVGSTNTIITKDGVKSFDTGGEIVGSGLAFVHDKERVLTQEQNANYMKLLDNIAYAKKLVDVSKINIQNYQQACESISDAQESQKAQTIIENVTCNFPNITTTDGLQKAILDLPRIALQRKK